MLGIAFGFGIPMAYAAIQERLPLECWVLFAANLFYSFAYDTEYAMVDRDDDARIGIRTSALTLGRWDVAAVAASYAAMVAILLVLGFYLSLSSPYYVGLGAAAAMIVLPLAADSRAKPRGLVQGVHAQHWVGAAIFAGIYFGLK